MALRFPGQWFQAETGLHQNWMRDYDPVTGRYIQPDPLGLDGGVALYGYALQSPMVYIDPRGENPAAVGGRAFCASFPALCKEIGRACAGAVIAGATWLGIINNSESGGDELGPISPATEGTQICDSNCDPDGCPYEVPLRTLRRPSSGQLSTIITQVGHPHELKTDSTEDVYISRRGCVYVGNKNGSGVGRLVGRI
jgi:RHS repeat-associated protein